MEKTLGQKIRELRRQKGWSQEQLAESVDYSRQLISHWEIDKVRPDTETLSKLADIFGVSTDFLLGRTVLPIDVPSDESMTGQRRIPIIGDVSCGPLMIVDENIENYLTLLSSRLPNGEVIAVHIRGDSMNNARLREGDLALVRLQEEAADRDIVVACIGEETTIKRIRHLDGYVALIPESDNPAYAPHTYRESDVRIVGVVIGSVWG